MIRSLVDGVLEQLSPRFNRLYARAELDLGYLYKQGKGVPLDHVAAYTWYKAAFDRGEKRAYSQLKSLSAVLTHEQITQALARAAELRTSQPLSQEDQSSEAIGSPFMSHP